ncbi:MAG TPA: hypothetical protein PLI95_15925, partial [Polyangiaceae bacterium]|nr:hypothetical protein [Polyangiaceae bacterium]
MKEFSKEALDELQFWAKTHAANNDTQDTATTLAVLAAALGSTPDELATAAGLAMASQGWVDSDELGRALGSLLLGAQLSPEAAL